MSVCHDDLRNWDTKINASETYQTVGDVSRISVIFLFAIGLKIYILQSAKFDVSSHKVQQK